MKLKALPLPKENGTHVRLTFKTGQEMAGTLFSAYKMPPGVYGVKDRWRVPFLPDGWSEKLTKSFSIRSIATCEVIL
jgi:hypothetical protein